MTRGPSGVRGYVYPEADEVFFRARSISVQEDEGFEELSLVDALEAFREGARSMEERVMEESVFPWDRELLRRGLERDLNEPRDHVGELCLGYAGSIGMMAMGHINQLDARVSLPPYLIRLIVRLTLEQMEHMNDLVGSLQGQVEEFSRVNTLLMTENIDLRDRCSRMERTLGKMADEQAMLGRKVNRCVMQPHEVIDLSGYDLGAPSDDDEKENELPLEQVLVSDVLDEPYVLTMDATLAPSDRDGRGVLQEIVERFEGTVAGAEFGEEGWRVIDSLYN